MQPSNQIFERVFSEAAIGMALVGLDGRWIKANDALCQMLGYSESDLLRTDLRSLTHRDDLTRELTQAAALVCGHTGTYRVEKRYFHKTGRLIWVQLTGSLVRKIGGMPDFFIAQVQDITEQKKTAAERDSFFSLSRDLLCILSHDLRLVQFNPAWEQVLGLTSSEFVMRPFSDLIHPMDQKAALEAIASVKAAVQTALQTAVPISFVTRCRTDKHDYRWIEWNAGRSVNGSLTLSGRDISQLWRGAEKHTSPLYHLSAMVERVPLMMSYYDTDLRNQFASARYCERHDLTPEQLRGKHLRDIIGEELFEQDRWAIDDVLRGHERVIDRTMPDPETGKPQKYLIHLVPDLQNGFVDGFYSLRFRLDATTLSASPVPTVKTNGANLYGPTAANLITTQSGSNKDQRHSA